MALSYRFFTFLMLLTCGFYFSYMGLADDLSWLASERIEQGWSDADARTKSLIFHFDFIDNVVFAAGVFFMFVYIRGRVNRLAVYAFGIIVPVQFIFFDIIYYSIPESSYAVTPLFGIMSYAGILIWRHRVKIFRVGSKFLAVTFAPLLAALSLLFFPLVLAYAKVKRDSEMSVYEQAKDIMFRWQLWIFRMHLRVNDLRREIPIGDTNLSLIIHRFLIVGFVIDVVYAGLCYAFLIYYEVPMDGYLSSYIQKMSIFDPALFHSFSYVLLQLFFITSFVVNTIADRERPDMFAFGKYVDWDKTLKDTCSNPFMVAGQKLCAFGMQFGVGLSLYGILIDSMEASIYGFLTLSICYYVAIFSRES